MRESTSRDVVSRSHDLEPAPPSVCVVIPSRNEVCAIRPCLTSVLAQTVPPDEILVCDAMSDDGTREIIREIAATAPVSIRLIDNPRRTIPSALNLSWAVARSDLLVRVDAHVVIPENYIERCREHLATGQWAGVGGTKLAVARSRFGVAAADAFGLPKLAGTAAYHHETEPREVDHVPFGAYPLYVVRGLRGWDESLTVNQDFEFDYRIRQKEGRLLHDPEIECRWRGRESVRALFRQYRRYGWGKVQVWSKHARSFDPRLLAPALVVLLHGAAVIALVARRRPWALVVPATYAAAVGGAVTRLRPDWPVRRALAASSAVMVMHVGFGIGTVDGLLGRVLNREPRSPRDLFAGNPDGAWSPD